LTSDQSAIGFRDFWCLVLPPTLPWTTHATTASTDDVNFLGPDDEYGDNSPEYSDNGVVLEGETLGPDGFALFLCMSPRM
jgi:hypothetical protein